MRQSQSLRYNARSSTRVSTLKHLPKRWKTKLGPLLAKEPKERALLRKITKPRKPKPELITDSEPASTPDATKIVLQEGSLELQKDKKKETKAKKRRTYGVTGDIEIVKPQVFDRLKKGMCPIEKDAPISKKGIMLSLKDKEGNPSVHYMVTIPVSEKAWEQLDEGQCMDCASYAGGTFFLGLFLALALALVGQWIEIDEAIWLGIQILTIGSLAICIIAYALSLLLMIPVFENRRNKRLAQNLLEISTFTPVLSIYTIDNIQG